MEKRICKECGSEFEISDGEANFYRDKNLSLPKRCRDCRKNNKKKSNFKNEVNLKPYNPKPYIRNDKKNYKKRSNIKTIIASIFIAMFLLYLFIDNVSMVFTPTYDIDDSYQVIENTSDIETDPNVDIFETIEAVEEVEEVEEITQVIDNSSITDESNEQVEATFDLVQETTYKFASKDKRDEHFKKHGEEFDYSNAMEYEAGASDVINNSESLHKIEAEDGDDVYYLEGTNEFVILSTYGSIRTYFRPDDGIDYFNRQ